MQKMCLKRLFERADIARHVVIADAPDMPFTGTPLTFVLHSHASITRAQSRQLGKLAL